MSDETNNPPAAPAAPAVPVTAEMNIAALKAAHEAELATLRAEFQQERLQTAVRAVQSVPTVPLGTGEQDIRREQAIKAAGGMAYWNQMTAQQRGAILGVNENVTDAELNKYFGKNSSIEAASLAKLNPSRYRALRVLARERGI